MFDQICTIRLLVDEVNEMMIMNVHTYWIYHFGDICSSRKCHWRNVLKLSRSYLP